MEQELTRNVPFERSAPCSNAWQCLLSAWPSHAVVSARHWKRFAQDVLYDVMEAGSGLKYIYSGLKHRHSEERFICC